MTGDQLVEGIDEPPRVSLPLVPHADALAVMRADGGLAEEHAHLQSGARDVPGGDLSPFAPESERVAAQEDNASIGGEYQRVNPCLPIALEREVDDFVVIEEPVDDHFECAQRSRFLPLTVQCCKQRGSSGRRVEHDLS